MVSRDDQATEYALMSMRLAEGMDTFAEVLSGGPGSVYEEHAPQADPELFTREPVMFRKASEGLAERQERLAAAEEEWLELEGLREG